jgi:hypothetical protein
MRKFDSLQVEVTEELQADSESNLYAKYSWKTKEILKFIPKIN